MVSWRLQLRTPLAITSPPWAQYSMQIFILQSGPAPAESAALGTHLLGWGKKFGGARGSCSVMLCRHWLTSRPELTVITARRKLLSYFFFLAGGGGLWACRGIVNLWGICGVVLQLQSSNRSFRAVLPSI